MKTIIFKENKKQIIPDNFTGKVIFSNGDIFYYKNGVLHRDNKLPAVEHVSGNKRYYVNGKRHRIDGPACEWVYGYEEYWVNGTEVSKESHDLLVNMLKLKEMI